jgi:hypothetical protein
MVKLVDASSVRSAAAAGEAKAAAAQAAAAMQASLFKVGGPSRRTFEARGR